jgi:Tfp pilus assembly protein PilF
LLRAAALSVIYAKQARAAAGKKPAEVRRLREQALGAALRLVAIDPRSAPARLILARAYGSTGDERRQDLALRAAVDLDPKSAAARNNLGVMLAAAGRLAEARGEFERAAELAPKAAWPVHNLAVLAGKDLADAEVAAGHRAKVEALVKAGAEAPPEAEAYWEFVPEEER